jgi:hypothetical protein
MHQEFFKKKITKAGCVGTQPAKLNNFKISNGTYRQKTPN